MTSLPLRLLVVDILRRGRWSPMLFAAMLFVMLWASREDRLLSQAFLLSAGLTVALGPMMTRSVPRLIWHLPVSHRDVWRAGWLVSTVVLVAMTTAVKLLAMLVLPHGPGLSGVTISAAYDVAAAGVGCGLVIVSAHSPWTRAPWRYLSSLVRQTALFLIPITFPAVMFGESLGSRLPVRWSELTGTGAAILAAMLALAIATYFHRPVPQTFASRQTRRAPPQDPRLVPTRGGLSGLPRLLAREYGFMMLFGVSIAAGSTLGILAMTGLLHSPEDVRALLRAELLLLDGSAVQNVSATPDMGEGYRLLAVMAWYGFFCASVAARFPAMTRHLRVLPLSTARLTVLLVGWPAVIWLTVWAAAIPVHYAVIGTVPGAFVPALLLGTAGLSALMQSLALRLTALPRLPFSLVVGLLPLIQVFTLPPSATAVAAVGLGALAAAAVITRAALRRNETYKNPPTAFGIRVLQTQNWK